MQINGLQRWNFPLRWIKNDWDNKIQINWINLMTNDYLLCMVIVLCIEMEKDFEVQDVF
jgi:hypothetical protein